MLKKIYPFIPTIVILLIIFLISRAISPREIETFVDNAGIWGPLALAAFLLVGNIFAPLSGTPAMIAGFFLYGSEIIFLIATVAFISHITNFWIARKLGRPIVEKLAGKESVEKVDKFTQDHGFTSLVLIRIFLNSFHDFVSYAFGLTNIPFSQYILASIIAFVPGTLLWYLLTFRIQSPYVFTVVTLLIGTIFSVIYFLIFKYRNKRLTK